MSNEINNFLITLIFLLTKKIRKTRDVATVKKITDPIDIILSNSSKENKKEYI